MVNESELRRNLASLLSGDLSLDEFEDWFAAASWNAHKNSSPAAIKLIGAIELRLAEHSNGDLSSDELLQELEALLKSEVVVQASRAGMTIPVVFHIGSGHMEPGPTQVSTQVSTVNASPRYRWLVADPALA